MVKFDFSLTAELSKWFVEVLKSGTVGDSSYF